MCKMLSDEELHQYMLLNQDDDDDNEDDDDEEETEKLRNLGLNDDEIKLVKNEGYEPTDFEDDDDEEYEDDDYYGEDV